MRAWMWSSVGVPAVIAALLVAGGGLAWRIHQSTDAAAALPVIGPAPDFTLTNQDGAPLSLSSLRGKVLAVTFIYTSCQDTCPVLTSDMAHLQDRLGRDFGAKVFFVSITVDPEHDTPAVLKQYASLFNADLRGWAFLTGAPADVADVARRFGVFARMGLGGQVEHSFLTSVIDQRGTLRVQYLGTRFDPEELLRDLQSLTGQR